MRAPRLLAGLFLTFAFLDGAESLLKNGDFDSGLKHWEVYGTAAKVFSAEMEGGLSYLHYSRATGAPSDNYHLDQTLSPEPKANYQFSFRYRCEASLRPVIALATTNFKQFYVKALEPSETWTNASFQIYSGNETALRLQLFAGAKGKVREAAEGWADFAALRLEKISSDSGSPARLVLDTERRGPKIPENFTGVNTLFWLETKEDLDDGRIASWLAGAKIGFLRYPGGTAGQNFDWRNASVLDPKKWPGEPKGVTYLDTEAFASLCQKTGAKPFIVLNLAGMFLKNAEPDASARRATAERAASWAAKFKEFGVKVACYELGNEHYLNDENSRYVMMRAGDYAALAREVIAAVRAADPEAAFGAVGPGGFDEAGYSDRAENKKWWPLVLDAIGKDLSHIILHRYWQGGVYEIAQIDYGEEISAFREKLILFGNAKGARYDDLKIGYTEWGGSQYRSPVEYGLFVHEALTSFAKHGADFAIEWPMRRLSGEWSNSLVLKNAEPLPAAGVLEVWAREFSGRPRLIPREKSFLPQGLFATAVKSERGISLLVGNRSSEHAAPLVLEVSGFAAKTIRLGVPGQKRGEAAAWHSGEAVTIPRQGLLFVEIE